MARWSAPSPPSRFVGLIRLGALDAEFACFLSDQVLPRTGRLARLETLNCLSGAKSGWRPQHLRLKSLTT